MLKLIIGFIAGVVVTLLIRFLILSRKDKRGRDYLKYNNLPLKSKMKTIIRKIIVLSSIREFNRDFTLNVKVREQTVLQLLHRAHFPQIISDASDVKFGIAIYIPLGHLANDQRECLVNLLKDEMEQFKFEDSPHAYIVIDVGTMVKYPGYLIAKIIKEVYRAEDVDFELSDEGFLPYHYNFDIPL